MYIKYKDESRIVINHIPDDVEWSIYYSEFDAKGNYDHGIYIYFNTGNFPLQIKSINDDYSTASAIKLNIDIINEISKIISDNPSIGFIDIIEIENTLLATGNYN